MAKDYIPRQHCFSASDFRYFEKCFFGFLVRHHLQKKYELEEGSANQAVGNILDLVIKKLHASKAYNQPLDYLLNALFKAAENDIREAVLREGSRSFYGASAKFLTPENIKKAQGVFKNYYLKRGGKINRQILSNRFWECILEGGKLFKIWGGPDALELGDDGVIEVVDYKYFERQESKDFLDMDLLPKIYTLLCAEELKKSGFTKARFRIRLWQEPGNGNLYEEFELEAIGNIKDYLRLKIEKILSINEITFCNMPYCKACSSAQRESWIRQLSTQFNFS